MFFEGCRNLKTNLPVKAFRDGGKPETSILKLYPFNFFSAFHFLFWCTLPCIVMFKIECYEIDEVERSCE